MENKSAVLICTCGKQLNLDYEYLKRETENLALAKSVTIHDLVCQEEGLTALTSLVEKNEGRVVIAACTNQKIQPRIEQYLRANGKDPSMIAYVNLREHSAWVHEDSTEATKKTLDMIRGGLARAAYANPVDNESKEIPKHVTVIGGGIAGMEAALSLSNLGYEITLFEQDLELGGHVASLPLVAPTGKSGLEILNDRLEALRTDTNINVVTESRVKYIDGEMGNFSVHYRLHNREEESVLPTSAVVLAAGFQEFKPTMMDEYRYGKNPDVITQLELSKMLLDGKLERPSDGAPVNEVVMVQCVGS
ncbi:MAG: FAD-dependent oxidoreductase, partial [Candidatus Hodarchaeota archaeon]